MSGKKAEKITTISTHISHYNVKTIVKPKPAEQHTMMKFCHCKTTWILNIVNTVKVFVSMFLCPQIKYRASPQTASSTKVRENSKLLTKEFQYMTNKIGKNAYILGPKKISGNETDH